MATAFGMIVGMLPPLSMEERARLRQRLADWTRHRDNLARDYAKTLVSEQDRALTDLLTEFRVFDAGIKAIRIALGESKE